MSDKNLILNGDFSQGDKHWVVFKPNPEAKAEFRDGYCYVGMGATVSQTVTLELGRYRLSFKSLFHESSESYVNLALEMTGSRYVIKTPPGSDYSDNAIEFEVTKVTEGQKDWLSLAMAGHQAGGKFRKFELIQIS